MLSVQGKAKAERTKKNSEKAKRRFYRLLRMCDCHEGAKSMFSDIKDLETK